MDVTQENFEEAYAKLERELPAAGFYAIDLEMTGIDLIRDRGHLPQDRYAAMAAAASKYGVLQYGITLFTWAADKGAAGQWVASPFNFYLFPEGRNTDVVLNADSIAFLKKHGMDFQKWIYQGVPFVNGEGEALLQKKLDRTLAELTAAPAHPGSPPGSPQPKRARLELSKAEDEKFVCEAMDAFTAWVANEAGRAPGDEFGFPKCNGFLRKALHGRLDELANDGSVGLFERETKRNDWNTLYVTLVTAEEKENRKIQKREEAVARFRKALGFRRVFQLLVQSKLPLVGHNLFYDLLFTFNHFDRPLPESWVEFQRRVGTLFPVIFDTKHLAENSSVNPRKKRGQHYPSTILGDLAKSFKDGDGAAAVCLSEDEAFGGYAPGVTDRYHEAGYDAYETGMCFVNIVDKFIVDADQDAEAATAGLGPAGVTAIQECGGAANLCHGTGVVFCWDLSPGKAPTPNTQLWGGALVRVDGLTAGDSAGTVHKLVPDAVGHKRLVWIGKYSCWVEVTPSGEQSKDLDSSVSSSNVLDIIAAGRASLDPPIGATVDSWENLNLPPTRPMQPVPAAPAPATEETWLGWLFGSNNNRKRKRGGDSDE